MPNLPPELAASLQEAAQIYTGLDLDEQGVVCGNTVSDILGLGRQHCDFCAQSTDNEPPPVVAVAPGGQVICQRCAAVALAVLARVKEAGRRLDYPGSRFITRERFAGILRELGVSVVGNMQLYYKLIWAVAPKNPLLLEISEVLEFMQQSDAEIRLREVGVGNRSLEHLEKLVGYLEKLPSDSISELLGPKGDES